MSAFYGIPLSPPSSAVAAGWGLLPVAGSRDDYPLIQAQCHYHLLDVGLRGRLVHTFISNATNTFDVNYRFPLPPDTSVHGFSAKIGDRRIQGVVREKQQARAEFEAAVAHGERAALLQQENVEIFKLSLGNVLSGQTVEVQLSFVQTVTHEGGVGDTMRLMFPLTIAPRYGAPPGGDPYRSTAVPATGSTLDFTLSLQMAASITSIASPSHPVSVTIGRLAPEDTGEHDGRLAHVSLATAALLEKDIVLLIGCQGLDRARCVVETFSPAEGAEEWTDAYALTFVPRFKLPEIPTQEYIFLVDRSGSMGGGSGKMGAVKSSLQIMLKSLPTTGTTFNIISFGSRQSKLWQYSEQYTAETVHAASAYVDKMTADHGGTEMKQALAYAFRTRQTNDPATVFVLTDGQSYDLDGVRDIIQEYVNKSKGHASFLRVFCMGIGNAVSKAMCDVIARSGNGTAVYVGEKEKPDQKLMGLLRAAAGPPIDDLEIDWGISTNTPDSSDDDGFSVVSSVSSVSSWSAAQSPIPTSLYDDNVQTYNIERVRGSGIGPRGNTLVLPPVPRIQQAPRARSLPSLFPGFRSSFYAIVRRTRRSQEMPSRSVRVTGNILGRPVALEIPVLPTLEDNAAAEKPIHLLAARAIVQSFEDMLGPRTVSDEGQIRRIGLRYGLATSQTSFVTVDQSGHQFDFGFEEDYDHLPDAMAGVSLGTASAISQYSASPLSSQPLGIDYGAFMSRPTVPGRTGPSSTYPPPSTLPQRGYGQPHISLGALNQNQLYGGPVLASSPIDDRSMSHNYLPPGGSVAPYTEKSLGISRGGVLPSAISQSSAPSPNRQDRSPYGSPGIKSQTPPTFYRRSLKKRSTDSSMSSIGSTADTAQEATMVSAPPTSSMPSVELFAREQLFDGSFPMSNTLKQIVLRESAQLDPPDDINNLSATIELKESIWFSLICLAYLDAHFDSERAVWDIMAGKARSWVQKSLQAHIDDERDLTSFMTQLESSAYGSLQLNGS